MIFPDHVEHGEELRHGCQRVQKKMFENDNDTTQKSPETVKLLGTVSCGPYGYEENPTCTGTLCGDRPMSIIRTITYVH